jgi:hypothetical protein
VEASCRDELGFVTNFYALFSSYARIKATLREIRGSDYAG